MTDILVLSVGTSTPPLEQCLERLRPRRAVFLCSQDTQAKVREILSNVRVDGFQPDRDVVVLSQAAAEPGDPSGEIDQLHRVYERCRDLFETLRQQQPGARIWVDYTGGTKTMATGLGLAAIDDGAVDLSLMTTGRRRPGESAVAGHSIPVQVNAGAIHFRRLIQDRLTPLLKRFDYAAAQTATRSVQVLPQSSAKAALLRQLEDLLLACDAWDRWDLERAEALIRPHGREEAVLARLLFPLQRLRQSCDLLHSEKPAQATQDSEKQEKSSAECEKEKKSPSKSEKKEKSPAEKALEAVGKGKIHGFEAVEDLLLNAARRASQERYDDAVGRLYRAMELTAQLLLLLDHGGIRSADVDPALLPEPLRPVYEAKRNTEKNRIELALTPSFDLLADLQHPVGQVWGLRRAEFVDALKARNLSLLAHGFRPVSYSDWQRLEQCLGGFLQEVLAQRRGALEPRSQLPTTLEGLGVLGVLK